LLVAPEEAAQAMLSIIQQTDPGAALELAKETVYSG
jgi:hypothetical protein